jgi:nitric oxide reductase activation protein
MLDYAADRKRKCMPSDRLYIKRIKQERSVSVLLLVDLSRSTAHPAAGKDGDRKTESVLGVEKEAIVLFVEALEAIGDDYAVAGFSGTGRLSVDYFRIKDFQESAEHRVRGRIGALNPRRNTRMGAAVRHGTRELGGTRSAVKLMIVLGDGFPNDTDYKQGYAIADTRQAILEAFSRHIHVRAITVNMAADPRLDELYGARHHHVISDVSELPERLVRMYRTLTRM